MRLHLSRPIAPSSRSRPSDEPWSLLLLLLIHLLLLPCARRSPLGGALPPLELACARARATVLLGPKVQLGSVKEALNSAV